jgi:hypothetical protein
LAKKFRHNRRKYWQQHMRQLDVAQAFAVLATESRPILADEATPRR